MKPKLDGETVWISTIQAMKSAAGWYLGRSCVTLEYPDDNSPPETLLQPYSRETEYMTQAEAEELLC
ncbi:MAG: hypothetical protein QF569_28895, partial [Candidatus Poribacteria bacterium]|nr:hypothetical protein [Candidatus Poribacteria bacterium]